MPRWIETSNIERTGTGEISMMGKCSKCGQIKKVRQHHYKGYDVDETLPYCYSCDKKAHINAVKNGRCNLDIIERTRLSANSSNRRNLRTLTVSSERMMQNVYLQEIVTYRVTTGIVSCNTSFRANNGARDGNKLYYIGCD